MGKEPGIAPIPSSAAASRLQEGLRAELDTYRVQLAEGLVDVGLAERRGAHDDAIAALEGHLVALETLQRRVEGVVAGAVAEREAEAVIDAVVPAVGGHPAPPHVHEPAAAMRRGLVTAAAMVALVVGGLASLPQRPPDPLFTAVEASEDALAAAQSADAGDAASFAELSSLSASLSQAIGDLPPEVLAEPEVRVWLGLVLTDQRSALLGLLDTMPEVGLLLGDLARLSASLDLTLPALSPPIEAVGVEEQPAEDPDGERPVAEPSGTRPASGQSGASGQGAAADSSADAPEAEDDAESQPILPEPAAPAPDEPSEQPEDPSSDPLGLPGGEEDLDGDTLGPVPR